MDKDQVTPSASESGSDWLDEILGSADQQGELGPDILAVTSARLTHPDDMELEKILAEDWDSVPDLDKTQENFDTTALFPIESSDAKEPTEETVLEETPEESFSAEEIIAEFSDNGDKPENADIGDTMFFQPVTEPQQEETTPDVPQEPVSEKEEPAPEQVRVRKIRPAPKKGYGLLGIPHILSTFVWLGIILLIGLTLGRSLWAGITDLMAFGKPDQQITITITDSEVLVLPDGTKVVNIDAISNKLKDAGLIANPQWFTLFASKLTDKANDIDIGTYTLNTKYDYNAIINNMQQLEGARKEVEILIPEGYTCAQIFALLQEKDVCTAEELEAYLEEICKPGKDGSYAFEDYWFLEDTPRKGKYWLEGYLFPDTYRFYVDDDPENVIKKFLDGFDFRFTDKMRNDLETLEERTGMDLTIHEVIIIASMIEKETAGVNDSYLISSVIRNRLTDNQVWHLNIDATIYYALGGNIDPVTGLPKPLTKEDMEMDHPYNTYKYTGLPPGAISNPGRNSLDAALNPGVKGIDFWLFRNGRPEKITYNPDDPNYTTEDFELYYYVFNPVEEAHIYSETMSNQEKAEEYINSLE